MDSTQEGFESGTLTHKEFMIHLPSYWVGFFTAIFIVLLLLGMTTLIRFGFRI